MRYTLLFIVALILISGFIAYFGDLLGRRMGKKRLTLFNLRPRHTAIIVTTITGMVISTLAIAALVMVNDEFRQVLTEGQAIIEGLSRDKVRLERRTTYLSQRRSELEQLVARRQAEVEAARADAAAAKQARDKLVNTVARLTSEVAARQRELKSVRAELAAAGFRLDQARSKLDQARSRVSEAQSRLAEVSTKLAGTEVDLRVKEVELEKRKEELAQAQAKVGRFEVESAVARSREFILRQGDEVMRGIISPRQSAFGLRGEIYSLLDRAGTAAERLGARAPDDRSRAVTVVYRQFVSKEHAVLVVNEPELIDKAIDTIVRSPMDVVVQMVCAVNTLPGEQVPVELRLWLNKLVYPRGSDIASTRIDGGLSEGRILVSLLGFLRSELTRKALDAGIIPGTSPDPRAALGQNPEAQVEELMDVVERVKQIGGAASVTVYATNDIFAVDSLNVGNVRFRVTKAQ
mgnify:CR=1 FL=1